MPLASPPGEPQGHDEPLERRTNLNYNHFMRKWIAVKTGLVARTVFAIGVTTFFLVTPLISRAVAPSIEFGCAGPSAMSRNGMHIAVMCGVEEKFLVSHDFGIVWTQSDLHFADSNGVRALTISDDGQILYATTAWHKSDNEWGGAIYGSVDGGESWSINVAAGTKTWWDIAASGDGRVVVATDVSSDPSHGSYDGGFYISRDSGKTWTLAEIPTTGYAWNVLISADGMIMVANGFSPTGWVWKSIDGGYTWTNLPELNNWAVIGMDDSGQRLVAIDSRISQQNQLNISTDGGDTFHPLIGALQGHPSGPIDYVNGARFTGDGSALLVAISERLSTSQGLYYTRDLGLTWNKISDLGVSMSSFATNYDGTRTVIVNATLSGAEVSVLRGIPNPTRPAPPTLFRVHELTDQSAVIHWIAPPDNGGSPITDYLVETSRDGSTWSAVPHTASAATSLTISGLAPGTAYQIRIATQTSVGTSETLSGSFTTLVVPPLAPQNLAVTSVTGTALTLTWEPPTSNGGSPITDYRIEVSNNGGRRWTAIPHTASSNRTFNVRNLAAGSTYQFRVATITSRGTSTPTSAISVTTVGNPPPSPTRLTARSRTRTTVTLAWTQPAVVNGSAVRNYIVEYSTDAGSTWIVATKPVSTSRSVTIGGFRTKSTYLFRVKAVNDVGESGYSNPISVVTR